MNENRRTVFLRISRGKTVVLPRDLIGVESAAVRRQDKYMLRHYIDDLAQLGFALPELFRRVFLLDGDGGQMGYLVHEFLMLRSGISRGAPVDRKGAQYFFIAGQYRRGPTSSKPMPQGEFPIVRP
jgi:hypothetical protein